MHSLRSPDAHKLAPFMTALCIRNPMSLVAYFCCGLALMSFVGIFSMPGGIGVSMFYIARAAVLCVNCK